MSNLDNKNKNLLVENIIVFFLFTVFLVFKSLKTLSKIFTYGIIKKEIFQLLLFGSTVGAIWIVLAKKV